MHRTLQALRHAIERTVAVSAVRTVCHDARAVDTSPVKGSREGLGLLALGADACVALHCMVRVSDCAAANTVIGRATACAAGYTAKQTYRRCMQGSPCCN